MQGHGWVTRACRVADCSVARWKRERTKAARVGTRSVPSFSVASASKREKCVCLIPKHKFNQHAELTKRLIMETVTRRYHEWGIKEVGIPISSHNGTRPPPPRGGDINNLACAMFVTACAIQRTGFYGLCCAVQYSCISSDSQVIVTAQSLKARRQSGTSQGHHWPFVAIRMVARLRHSRGSRNARAIAGRLAGS